jgi:dipeptidyl aminopeptidase/acylaminoacyl peptidase
MSLRAQGIDPERIVDLREVKDIQVSPNGKLVAFVVTEPADRARPENVRNTDIWVVPSDGSHAAHPYAASTGSETSPRWSPDGKVLAFLSDRGERASSGDPRKQQLYLLRIDGGEARQLTNIRGGVGLFAWSPDGRMIAFTSKDPLTDAEEQKERERDDAIYVGGNLKYSRLWVVSTGNRELHQIPTQDLNVHNVAWSPDSSALALYVSSMPTSNDIYWHLSLIVVNSVTGARLTAISDNVAGYTDYFTPPKWSPDGLTIAFFEFTPRRISRWLSLASIDGGKTRPVLKSFHGTIRRVEWGGDSKHLIAESNEGARDRFLRVDSVTDTFEPLEVQTALTGPDFSVSQDGRTIAYAYEAGDTPTEVWSVTMGSPPRRLAQFNPQVKGWQTGQVEQMSWRSKADGLTIYGVLVRPPGYRAKTAYPLIVLVHGGPEWAWWTGWHCSWLLWAQMLATRGYAVFLPNPRGSTGQGGEFSEANLNDWGGKDFQDIMDGVDELVKQGVADPERLGIGGSSYGGYMSMWAVTQTNRFKAAVSVAGISNLSSFNGTTDITPDFLGVYFPGPYFERQSLLDSRSAMTFLKNCRTPTLVLHGGNDVRVPPSQSLEFYNGLKVQGVKTDLVIYPRESHGIFERAHQIDMLKRVIAWYGLYLKPR